MRRTWAVALVTLSLAVAARDASACPPRCPTPDGPLRSAEDERDDAIGCEMVEEDLLHRPFHWRDGLVGLLEALLRAQRNAAVFHARADRARR